MANRPRYVDTRNPALAIDCPRCGLRTARFMPQCRNCGYSLWPNPVGSSAAFKAWQGGDPELRGRARPYDLALPEPPRPLEVDYEARAHELGIHIFPSSNFPFLICLGLGIAAFGAIPFSPVVRIIFGAVGAVIFLIGVVGWVIVEDTRYFPVQDVDGHHEGTPPPTLPPTAQGGH